MKALFIGGTGTISAAVSQYIVEQGWELYLLNRGNRNSVIKGKLGQVVKIKCDIREDDAETIRAKIKAPLKLFDKARGGRAQGIGAPYFDVVADFIAFTPDHVKKDFEIFNGLCRQYIFISSASAYQKPLSSHLVTESTPLANPYWEYSQDKIACEEFLREKYRESGFPVTIVRPSHTYDERSVPLGVHGKQGSWQVVKRMIEGKPVIVHGDGTSLWAMTHNSDFARAFAGIMGNIHALGEDVHITTDEILTWNQIYHCIADALNVPLKAVHIPSDFLAGCAGYDFTGSLLGDKANSVVFDNAKIKRLVPGFSAQVRFDQGIKETVAHVLKHKECQNADADFDAWCDRVIAAREKALQEMD